MNDWWVISWLGIDYWQWSMSNRWVIEAKKFCGLSITHWYNWLFINDPSITHRILYCTWKTLFLLSCTAFFFCLWFSLYLKFLLTMLRCKVLITNADDSQLCNISLYPALYFITKQLNSNQPVWKWNYQVRWQESTMWLLLLFCGCLSAK